MLVLSFLEGEGRDAAGWLVIGEILALNDHELERRHDFIQWLFALPEPSRAQAQITDLDPGCDHGNSGKLGRTGKSQIGSAVMSGFYQRSDH